MQLFKLTCVVSLIGLSGCMSYDNDPLLFGQNDTGGVSISATTTDQGGRFLFGYSGQNFAIIPMLTAEGKVAHAHRPVGEATDGAVREEKDTMSVLGQFEMSATDGDSNGASLGKFFATGFAAEALAQGFAESMAGDDDGS